MDNESIKVGGKVNKFVGCVISKLLSKLPYELWIMMMDGRVTEEEIDNILEVFRSILFECLGDK